MIGSSEINWSDVSPDTIEDDKLPPPNVEQPPDRVGLLSVEPGYCATCGEAIIREPGARGRFPKYHPDCRPSKTKQGSSAAGRIRRTSAESKREAEAALAIELLQPYVMQLAMGLSFVDQFDAYAILAGWPGVRDNLHGLMIRYDWLRAEALAISTGGSILGMALSLAMIGLPIAAHHKLIKGKTIAPILERAPFMLSKMQERMAEGPDSVKGFLEDQLLKKMQTQNGSR